jgi:hypothetical protein
VLEKHGHNQRERERELNPYVLVYSSSVVPETFNLLLGVRISSKTHSGCQ